MESDYHIQSARPVIFHGALIDLSAITAIGPISHDVASDCDSYGFTIHFRGSITRFSFHDREALERDRQALINATFPLAGSLGSPPIQDITPQPPPPPPPSDQK